MSDRGRSGRSPSVHAGAALLLAAALGGCTTLDNAVGKVPWFTTMRDQAVTRPFEARRGAGAPRPPPAGSVPVTGVEDSLDVYTKDLKEIRNPAARDSA